MSKRISFDYFHILCAYLFLLTSLVFFDVAFSCPKKSSPKPPEDPERIFIAAPKSIRLDTNQGIAIVGTEDEELTISLRDYPGETTVFYYSSIRLEKGIPTVVNVFISSVYFQEIDFKNSNVSPYAALVVESKNFKKSFKLKLLHESGYVFIQTDKPIYNPEQEVKIRVIPLNEDLLQKDTPVHVQIRNPQNVIVHEKDFPRPWKTNNTEFPTLNYKFPPYPLLGNWSVSADYGINQRTTVSFIVKEYVLPTYKVQIKAPSFILPKPDTIYIKVFAEYYYGKKVNGVASYKIRLQKSASEYISELLNMDKTVENGESVISFNLTDVVNLNDFPYDSTLLVDVSVTDNATGNVVQSFDNHCKFVKSPYSISLRETINDFKWNVKTAIVADVTYSNGKAAPNILTSITAETDRGEEISVYDSKRRTDEEGRVIYFLYPPANSAYFFVTVFTNDESYTSQEQASKRLIVNKYESDSYIAISRTETARKLRVGETFAASIFTGPNDKFDNFFFVVMSRGKIVLFRYIPKRESSNLQLEFVVTAEMAPVLRIVVFSLQENKELLIDSLRMYVENACDPKSEVSVETNFPSLEPGKKGMFILKGKPRTKIGMLAVDKAVYGLKNNQRLTKKKIFESISTRDLGFSPGGGMNPLFVLSRAGITIFVIYDKRENKKENNGGGGYRPFLVLTHRISFDFSNDKKKDEDDFDVLEFGIDDVKFGHDDIDEMQEDLTPVRKDFRESWLFRDTVISSDGTAVLNATLPDSITTWVIQSISLSTIGGLCVSPPTEIVSFKNIFLRLNIPYSVVRKEKLEIQATVYNYYSEKIPVIVFMYGVAHLCSGIEPGKKSERKRITVEANSAESVRFPVVPMKAKKYTIRVVALSPVGSDVVVKKLNVVSEGVVKEEDIVILLDPTNKQKRKRRHLITERISDFIDESENLQITKINLQPKPNYIADSEKCIVSMVGTEYGPSVESVLIDPENLIRMPTGCCEQTMMYMGPTLYTLYFLKSKGSISEDLEENLYDFVRIGYKRGLSFRKYDGSYSVWPHRPSSTWLTAYVMKIFSQASKYIFVDKFVICRGISWLLSQQGPDGGFRDSNPVIRRNMDGENGKIALTAFVLIALQESTCSDKLLFISRLMAKIFLENEYSKVNDTYTMALVAYALALTNSDEKFKANVKLLLMSTFDEEINYRYWQQPTTTQSIEVTAYGLLTQVRLDDLSNSQSVVNWLNKERLYGGSFPSSQSTVIALQALSNHLVKSKSGDISLSCNFTSDEDGKFLKDVEINNNNALVLQNFVINNPSDTLSLHTTGKGIGVLSMKLKYNVLEETEKVCKFETTIDLSSIKKPSRHARIFNESKIEDQENDTVKSGIINDSEVYLQDVTEVKICTRFLSNKNSEMTIIEFGIVSGFNAIKADLDKLVKDNSNPVDRYENANKRIIFYLDHVSYQKDTCLMFRTKREYIVENLQASVIKVYEYYNNDNSCTITYGPDSKSELLNPVCEGILCQCDEEGLIKEKVV
ncbi:A.superbus venom factor 1-like [Centruroides vittatus]|uniref:A.superbus venom factor 1-like n=1 Tax=Centruroides vittatus TaxID=120091 RepID=UPI00350F7FCF